jgi:hypothetical protein
MSNRPCALTLPDGSCYDASKAQDHTGVTFGSLPKPPRRDPKRDPRNFMRRPAWLQCPRCKSESFRVLTEDHPQGDGLMQLYCPVCHDAWPVLQMQQPQMSNHIARQLGLPEAEAPGIDITVDLNEE